jgi:ubiquinone/menaquinone biosynthesis C-methylase UbiE
MPVAHTPARTCQLARRHVATLQPAHAIGKARAPPSQTTLTWWSCRRDRPPTQSTIDPAHESYVPDNAASWTVLTNRKNPSMARPDGLARQIQPATNDAAHTPLGRVRGRYGKLASVYELTLGERLLYADARRRAIKSLQLSPGATVVDVACGTGFNFPLIEERIGPSGTLIGVDLTAGMLDRARARVQRAGWSNVRLVRLDATSLTCTQLERAGALAEGKEVDAVLCTLGMSVIPEWKAAWEAMVALVRPGGTAAIWTAARRPDKPSARDSSAHSSGWAAGTSPPTGPENLGNWSSGTSTRSRSAGPTGDTYTPPVASGLHGGEG